MKWSKLEIDILGISKLIWTMSALPGSAGASQASCHQKKKMGGEDERGKKGGRMKGKKWTPHGLKNY